MKAQDLRIGNTVNRMYWNINPRTNLKSKEYETCNVISLGLEKILTTESLRRNKYIKSDYHLIKPIPLTKNLVSNLKFMDEDIEVWESKKVNEYEYYDRFVFYNVIDGTSNLEIHLLHTNYGNEKHQEFLLSIDNDEVIPNQKELIYLHELQNLVYSITGYELTI